ncbi:hypothetical protein ACQP1P_38630 [Dactylosporangium sp. CA-052675]|uniref:hypothetical protein n=1 Tax=Dactylosporangium sp. CA-052675 TaxID=3239927 RepID=UPI003D92929D
MRVVRCEMDWDDHARSGETAYELRIWLNRFDVKVLGAYHWLGYVWYERGPVFWYARFACRVLRRHNVFCRGRSDARHFRPGVGLVDPDRQHYRPRG